MLSNPRESFLSEKEDLIDDYLPVYQEVPPSQRYFLVNYVEHQKSLVQAIEEITMREFIAKMGKSVFKKTIGADNWDLFSKKYTEFKSLNQASLNDLVTKELGDDYDKHRVLCVFGCYPTAKAAQKVADELLKTRGELYGSYVVQETGYYVPFNPTPEMCSDFTSTNKMMNDFMKGQQQNKIDQKAHFNLRKQALITKSMKDAEKRGEKIVTKSGIEKLEDDEKVDEVLDHTDMNDKLSLKNNQKSAADNARAVIDMEIKLGNFDLIQVESLKMLGYSEEIINKAKEAQNIKD